MFRKFYLVYDIGIYYELLFEENLSCYIIVLIKFN